MDKYGDRIVDWYFNRDDGIPQHLKMNQLGRLADIIKYEGPQTGFWKVKASLYDNIALTGFDPRRICWNEMIYDPADNKPTTFAKEPPPSPSPAPSVIVLSPKKRQYEEIIVLDSDDEDSGPDSKKSKSDSEDDDEDNNYSDDTDDSFIDDEETDEDDLEVINGKQ